MSRYNIKNEEEKIEYFDEPEVLEQKIEQLADMVRNCKNMSAFTGAGLSTAAGIPDYRSGANTVVETGAGCWEKAANIEKARKEGKLYQQPVKSKFEVTIQKAFPTKGHMALKELMDRDILKSIISQNLDGLHRKSGIPANKIYELHGNTNLEVCEKCNQDYMRDFRVRDAQKVHDHKTSRTCDNKQCNGQLHDSIINFGENLKSEIIQGASKAGMEADLMLCLGSSLRVQPANLIPINMKMVGGKYVIVNLQKTPLNGSADLVIHARIQTVMTKLMQKLEMPIPQFKLDRWAEVSLEGDKIQVNGIDKTGGPYTLFKNVKATYDKNAQNQKIDLTFQGHYNENTLTLYVPTKMLQEEGKIRINMVCNPYGCSNDNQRVTFGYWDTAQAFLMSKDGSEIDMTNAIDLKYDQGPLKPTKESLLNTQNANGNNGTATPKSFNLKGANPASALETKSSKGPRTGSSQRLSPAQTGKTNARNGSSARKSSQSKAIRPQAQEREILNDPETALYMKQAIAKVVAKQRKQIDELKAWMASPVAGKNVGKIEEEKKIES